MADAIRDQNHVPSKLAVLNTDTVQGTHLVTLKINGSNEMLTNTTASISFTMVSIDPHDHNYVDVWCFQGDSDGLVYPAVATADGELLIDET